MLWLILSIPVLAIGLAYLGAPLIAWLVVGLAWFVGAATAFDWSAAATVISMVIYAAILGIFLIAPLRKSLLTAPLFKAFRATLPTMSQTERDALEAGTVWWDGDLFSGNPDWQKMRAYPWPKMTDEERSFLDKETHELCAMTNDWECNQKLDMPIEVWNFIKEAGFLGMIIPKEYGGKGFSAYAHSQVVTKLSTRSSGPAVTVMVPNSLGPAELLLHYGTEEQKNYYLPRLAKGLEIPAFALTSPWAGSDAASIPDAGVVCKGTWQGKEVLGMRVSFNKRYITLAPVCTVFGLAFRLFDPDGLLGAEKDIGITCALVPYNHPGVDIGRRHLPLDAFWMNGPIRGEDVFIPMDFIIGGPKMAGHGWRMLMDCLAAGRSISLPASNVGMQKMLARGVGAYARIRSQFKTAIGRFEGIEEALARIGGKAYLSDAARAFTAGAIDLGEKPSVVSAIMKYHMTEFGRQSINDGMDICGGKGICLGPKNIIGRAYQQVPVGITVEGANILTRSLIIFGQGAIRCHPYVLKEMRAGQQNDAGAFDKALWSHIGFTITNAARATVMGLTGAAFVRVPSDIHPELRSYYKQLTRYSSAFAFTADLAMGTLGGTLKRKEKLSARLGDILSYMYLASTVLKRYEVEGYQKTDAALMHWSMQFCLFQIEEAFEGVINNFPGKAAAAVLRSVVVFPLGKNRKLPNDDLGQQVAQILIEPSATLDRLTHDVFRATDPNDPMAQGEAAFVATVECEPIEMKIKQAQKSGQFQPGIMIGGGVDAIYSKALEAKIITQAEFDKLKEKSRLRDEVIHVDDFPYDFGRRESLADVELSDQQRRREAA